MPTLDSPKFVFAHIMCPHEPFVFGPYGEKIKKEDRGNWKKKEIYLGQYIFTCKKVISLIDSLLKQSDSPPIIILQSDHGIRTREKRGAFFDDEWRWIFNALYLPMGGKKILGETLSPVNTFRLVFNYYFCTNHEIIKN
jgi:hypothetical protein